MAGCDCQHADDGDTRRRGVDGRRTLCLSRCVRAGLARRDEAPQEVVRRSGGKEAMPRSDGAALNEATEPDAANKA